MRALSVAETGRARAVFNLLITHSLSPTGTGNMRVITDTCMPVLNTNATTTLEYVEMVRVLCTKLTPLFECLRECAAGVCASLFSLTCASLHSLV